MANIVSDTVGIPCLRAEEDVNAEGVESSAVLTALGILEVPYVQGYVYSRPLPAERLSPMLRHGFEPPKPELAPGHWLAAYAAHMRWMGDNISLPRRNFRHVSATSLRNPDLCPLHAVFAAGPDLLALHEQEHALMGAIAEGETPWGPAVANRLQGIRAAIEQRLESLARELP